MLSSGNSALYISIINSRSNQPQPISPQVPANFIEMHIPQNMPRMRSRAQRRAEEKQAMKMTRVGGPTLYRPQMSRAEFVGRIERQRNPALSERISDPAVPPALYEEFMLACNYDALTSAATDLFHQVAAGAWALSEYLPALHIGPPMTQAALVGVNTKNNKHDDVNSFTASFEKDFDIRMSVDLDGGDSFKGVTVFIGEIHGDPAMQSLFKQVLKSMQVKDGDLLLSEGDALSCKADSRIYQIPFANCISIEEHLDAYVETKKILLNHKNDLLNLVKYIQSKIKTRSNEVINGDPVSYISFIKKYEKLIPEKYMPEFKSLMALADHSGWVSKRAVKSQNDLREKNFMEKVKHYHHLESTNFVIFGARHLVNLADDLLRGKAGRAILMMPYILYETQPDLTLPLKRHDEL